MRIVVVGAGVLGASAAYHAAYAGADVVVVDHAHEGRATAAGAGIVCPWASEADDEVFYELYTAGAHYYAEMMPALAEFGDIGYRRSGALCVSREPGELARMHLMLRGRRDAAPDAGSIDLLSPSEARALFPPLDRDFGAVRISGGARVDGRRLAATLLAGAQAHGARLRRGEARLLAAGNQITGVQVSNDTISADTVIVAAGAWAPFLLRPLGVDLPIEPQRGQITHLRLQDVDTSAWPVILPPGSHYLLAFEDGRIVAGATREAGVGFDYRVTAAGQAEVLSEALAVAPGLAAATLTETRIGFRPVTPEIRPLLGMARGWSGLAIGNGLGASGLTIGPLAGRLLSNSVLGQAAEIDLAPFDPLRRIGRSWRDLHVVR